MAKIKIEIEIDVDFQKHFDNIPKKLYKNKKDDKKVDNYYMLESIHDVLNDSYIYQLMTTNDWMVKSHKNGDKNFEFAKHHLEISTEVANQISKNAKITIIK